MPEEWGGDVPFVEVSAREKLGLDDLLEVILLVADVHELKANPHKPASGVVVEAKVDRNRGPVATLLIQSGTLNMRDIVVAGATWGRVKAMFDDRGQPRPPGRAEHRRSRSSVCSKCRRPATRFRSSRTSSEARELVESAAVRSGGSSS